MVLSPEQQERIRRNRERAFELQRQRQREKKENQEKDGSKIVERTTTETTTTKTTSTSIKGKRNNRREEEEEQEPQDDAKRQKTEKNTTTNNKVVTRDKQGQKQEEEDDTMILEDFEEGASPWVTKGEAKKMYCLPEGSLAVCDHVEKPNPHHKGWTPMKMYHRSEIRRKARKRYGGIEGLKAERRKREDARFVKDMKRSQSIFQK